MLDSSSTTDISVIHSDIIQTHIFTRLDGPSLASTACVSSEYHSLSIQEKLWKDISFTTWPSTKDPQVQEFIATLPSGHRSFFSDAFPVLSHHHQNPQRPSSGSRIISAVDIQYKSNLVFSKVHDTGLVTGWLNCAPFKVSLLSTKESVPTSILRENSTTLSQLEENLTLSWILIDPVEKRAGNLSSMRPISVQRHWLMGDVQVRYATVLANDSSEFVECKITVTLGGKEGEEMYVKEVTMQVEDMDGKVLNGEESLVILQGALESTRRKKGNWEEELEEYREYLELRKEKRERKNRREWNFDIAGICIGVTLLVCVCGLAVLTIL